MKLSVFIVAQGFYVKLCFGIVIKDAKAYCCIIRLLTFIMGVIRHLNLVKLTFVCWLFVFEVLNFSIFP